MSWDHLGSKSGSIGINFRDLEAILALGWGVSWAKLDQVGTKLGQVKPRWQKLDPSWGQVKPSWGQVEAKLGQAAAKLGQVGIKLGPSWVQVGSSWFQNAMGKDIQNNFCKKLKMCQNCNMYYTFGELRASR
eukprot:4458115-Karenia_brevis.AAC.1